MHQSVINSAQKRLKAAERGIGTNFMGRVVCVATLLFGVSALVFGRDPVPIVHGTAGVIISLEGFNGVARRDPVIVRRFGWALEGYCAISAGIGAALISERYSGECDSTTNPAACKDTFIVFGVISVFSAAAWFVFGWGMLAYSHVLTKQEENIFLSMSMLGLPMTGLGHLRTTRRDENDHED